MTIKYYAKKLINNLEKTLEKYLVYPLDIFGKEVWDET